MVFRVASSITGSGGALGNYGFFLSTQNQTNGGETTENLVSFNTQVGASGITNSSGTITFTTAGVYQVILELAWTSSTGANPTITSWFQQNSANIANSSQDFQLLGGANTVQFGSCVFIITAAINDTVKAYWSCSDTNVSLAYQGVQSNPDRPASPSAFLSIVQV